MQARIAAQLQFAIAYAGITCLHSTPHRAGFHSPLPPSRVSVPFGAMGGRGINGWKPMNITNQHGEISVWPVKAHAVALIQLAAPIRGPLLTLPVNVTQLQALGVAVAFAIAELAP